MKKIDILAYKFDVDNTDDFNEDVIIFSKNSIILNWNSRKIWVQYKPADVNLIITKITFLNIHNKLLRYLLSPFLMLAHSCQVFFYFFYICIKVRPKIFIVENFLEGMIGGIIRRLNLVDKSIYLPCDWFQGHDYKRAISNIANNLLFPRIDLLACRLNDVTLDRPSHITQARNKYWKKIIPTTKIKFFQQPRLKVARRTADGKSNNICFIGEMREDSGLDIAIKALSLIRKDFDIRLKVLGNKRLNYKNFKQLAEDWGVSAFVSFLGFVERGDFKDTLSDCFCGISLLKTKDSYSSYGLPSKIMYYFLYQLPVITTQGLAADDLSSIRNNNLGLIINPTVEDFAQAAINVYVQQDIYPESIKKYIESFPKTGIINVLNSGEI